MQQLNLFKVFTFFLITAFLLAACGGTLPASVTSAGASKVQANVVAFTGTVQAINGSEWTIAGQKLSLDPEASLDPNIAVGDEVKVEAHVSSDGTVVVQKIESSAKDDISATPHADASGTPDPVSSSTPDSSSSSGTSPSSIPHPVPALQAGTNANEVFGAVEALTADTITINGVTYSLASFTEFKNQIGVGDQVKVHVSVGADGTLTVREIEKSQASIEDNSNSSGSVSDDSPQHDVNDDHSNHSSMDDSHNGSDVHGNEGGTDDQSGNSNGGSADD